MGKPNANEGRILIQLQKLFIEVCIHPLIYDCVPSAFTQRILFDKESLAVFSLIPICDRNNYLFC